MGIGRRYFQIAAILLCAFICSTHYTEYPNRSWKPHKGWGSREQYRKEEAARAAEDKKKAHERREPQERREDRELEKARVNADRAEAEAFRAQEKRERAEKRARRSKSSDREETTFVPRSQAESRSSRSSRSSDGDEDREAECEVRGDTAEASVEPLLSPSRPALRTRRVNASPEKFDKGRFESLTIQPPDDRPAKKRRLEANVEISYDSTGTPQLSAFPRIHDDAKTPTDITPSRATTTTANLLNTPTAASTTLPTKRAFNLIDAICKDSAILIHVVSFLPLPSLISLYSISKPFHYLLNRHYTSFVLSSMRTWAPDADTIYPWRCYKSLCVKDPSRLQKPRLAGKEAVVDKKWDDLRDVPSLRWLQMVVWREGVCRDMIVQLATQGLRVPWGTLESVKKMWFLMDLPLNSQRIALIQNKEYIPNGVLLGMTFFLLKVDALLTDPLAPPHPANHPNQRLYPNKYAGGMQSGVPLRKMLLAERYLSALWRVMRGWSWDSGFGTSTARPLNRLDILRLWVKHKYNLPPLSKEDEDAKKMPIMGIPWHSIGTAGLERTGVAFHDLTNPSTNTVIKTIPIINPAIAGSGLSDHQAEQVLYPHQKRIILCNEKPREILLRPDELVLKEGIRRRLKMHKLWWKIMFYGFCDELGREIKVPTEEEVLARLREGPKRKAGKGGQ